MKNCLMVFQKFWAKWIIQKKIVAVGVCVKRNKSSALVIQIASFI